MTAPISEVPIKCNHTPGAGTEANPCTVPGSMPRCLICPNSPTYWRRAENAETEEEVAR